MMERLVTGAELKLAAELTGKRVVPIKRCSLCRAWVHYLITDNAIYFDGKCSCHSGVQEPRKIEWDAAAKWVNDQLSIKERMEIAARFGFVINQKKTEATCSQ